MQGTTAPANQARPQIEWRQGRLGLLVSEGASCGNGARTTTDGQF